MSYCVRIDQHGATAARWGRAERVAVAEVAGGRLTDWQVHEVGWDALHDTGSEGAHHARVARFLREHDVDTVVVDHVGPGMARMLGSMHIRLATGHAGDARAAVLAAARDA